ncbi:MAG: hypothetical protein H8E44_24010 [Planctomycetes bacterium]|nr:hypothetical protein [Planctomycetota bacterium]MBL7040880.1 hypothetical protein [Pirellulaceae bacterium]
MFPESNNCYGRIKPACNLGSLAIQLSNRGWQTRFQAASCLSRESLRVEADSIELRFEPTDGGQHLFNGAFDGNRGEFALTKLSSDFRDLQIPHRFELYNDSDSLYREFKFADDFLG